MSAVIFSKGRRVIPPGTPPAARTFGLGDLVAVVAEPVKRALGRTHPRVKRWLSGCGCAGRRARWNRRWPLWRTGVDNF